MHRRLPLAPLCTALAVAIVLVAGVGRAGTTPLVRSYPIEFRIKQLEAGVGGRTSLDANVKRDEVSSKKLLRNCAAGRDLHGLSFVLALDCNNLADNAIVLYRKDSGPVLTVGQLVLGAGPLVASKKGEPREAHYRARAVVTCRTLSLNAGGLLSLDLEDVEGVSCPRSGRMDVRGRGSNDVGDPTLVTRALVRIRKADEDLVVDLDALP